MSLQKIIDSGNVEFVRWILDEFNPDTTELTVHHLCVNNRFEMVELLIRYVDNVDKIYHGYTAFQVALRTNSIECANILYDHANINLRDDYDCSPLGTTIIYHQKDMFAKLIDDPRLDINVQDKNGNTILHDICCWALDSKLEMLKLILDKFAFDINLQNNNGFTLLICACKAGSEDYAKFLLKRDDVDVLLTDSNGHTAKDWAEMKRLCRIEALLSTK